MVWHSAEVAALIDNAASPSGRLWRDVNVAWGS
jgi:hypothetical protein